MSVSLVRERERKRKRERERKRKRKRKGVWRQDSPRKVEQGLWELVRKRYKKDVRLF